jgi:hypothetical protein
MVCSYVLLHSTVIYFLNRIVYFLSWNHGTILIGQYAISTCVAFMLCGLLPLPYKYFSQVISTLFILLISRVIVMAVESSVYCGTTK